MWNWRVGEDDTKNKRDDCVVVFWIKVHKLNCRRVIGVNFFWYCIYRNYDCYFLLTLQLLRGVFSRVINGRSSLIHCTVQYNRLSPYGHLPAFLSRVFWMIDLVWNSPTESISKRRFEKFWGKPPNFGDFED